MTTAQEFLAWQETLGEYSSWTDEVYKERSERFKALSAEDKYTVKRGGVEAYFVPENASPDGRREEHSPSGRWKLVVTPYGTKPGSWKYTRGEVYDTVTGAKVADVKRNYWSFWTLWAEGHAVTGDDYLICGEDYQGYTLVNLTRGTQRSYIPDEAFEGHGWCPSEGSVVGDGTLLQLEGCFWACPYNYRILDFSDPDAPGLEANGFPDLTKDLFLDMESESVLEIGDDKTLTLTQNQRTFKATGEFRNYEIENKRLNLLEKNFKAEKSEDKEALAAAKAEKEAHDALYDLNQEDLWVLEPSERQVYRLVDGKYTLHEEWKHEKVLKREADNAVWEARKKEERARYESADPFLAYLKGRFPKASRHISYLSLRMAWDGDTNPFYQHFNLGDGREVSWGAEYGDFKARGKGIPETSFPRTLEGLQAALEALSV